MTKTLILYFRRKILLELLNGWNQPTLFLRIQLKPIFISSHDHIELLVNSAGDQLFFRHREGQWMPTLKLYHKFPVFLPKQQVDKGAIRFVLSGANIMCPGMIDLLFF